MQLLAEGGRAPVRGDPAAVLRRGEHDGMWQGELEVRELAAILLKDLASNSNRSIKLEYVIDLLAHLA